MKHLTGMERSKRMEKSYIEALGLMGDLKTVYDKATIVVEQMIHNVAARVEWKIQEAARKPRQPIALTDEVAELERLSRIVSTLQDPRMDGYRTGDPDSGAREIVRILELARKEYGNNGNEKIPEGAGVKEVPDGMDKEEGQGDESRQTPTVERPPEPRHRILGHGKVRRGSG